MAQLRTRFAPSPTGYLHIGHAASAFHVWAAAQEAGGDVVLRIEDIDQTRCRPEFEDAIYEDLAWLGLEWTGGIRRQSNHYEDYAKVLDALAARGLVYRCFRTRKEVLSEIDRAPHGASAAFIGEPLSNDEENARIRRGEAYAWRLSLTRAKDALGPTFETLGFSEEGKGWQEADPDAFGDVVLARKDIPTSYHLATTHDDALQAMTHIIRGEDLFASTSIHVLLQALMGWPTPIYRHHDLLLDEHGKRFAKRDKSRTLRAMREDGFTPANIRHLTGAK
ncbi:MAG: tRNA glutamyl-Q(34) synthetase GluQRS [Pseudomonadota bacterium]